MNKYLKTKEGSLEDLAKQMQNKVLESDYQDKFKKELDKAGKPLGQMTGAEKKAFFNKIDKMHKGKNEAVDNPYAVGMAQAMKSKNDQPPLKKSTITKAHDIAKSIKKESVSESIFTDTKNDGQGKSVSQIQQMLKREIQKGNFVGADKYTIIEPGLTPGMKQDMTIKHNDFLQAIKKHGATGFRVMPMGESIKEVKEDFFVNDKKDTLKKFSGRIGYNKGTLTDYLAKKTGKKKDDVYFDDTELVYKDKTVLRNAETKTVDQMLKALQKEDYTKKDVDKFHTKLDKLVHKSFGHSSDEKKEKNEEVHPHVKQMVKKGDSDEKIKKMHPEINDDELEKLKETHSYMTNKMNQRQKEVGGEKEPIKTPKNEWKTFAMMAAELREKKEEADKGKKEQEAGEDTRDKKQKTMTGQVATSPEMNPKVDYKY